MAITTFLRSIMLHRHAKTLPGIAAPLNQPGTHISRLPSVHNFRDIAGAGYRGYHGIPLRQAVLYRSSVFTPSSTDLPAVDLLQLRGIYDLRTAEEIAELPVNLPHNIEYTWIDIIGHNDELVYPSHEIYTSVLAARAYLAEMNRSFVYDVVEREGFGKALKLIAYCTGTQAFHCSSGKDRTGWLTAIIHNLLGMSENDVIYDYLLSNHYSAAFIQASAEEARERGGPAEAEAMHALMSVHPEALAAGFIELNLQYGTVREYVRKGLGVGEDVIELLQEKLLLHP